MRPGHRRYRCTREQRANLEKLADFLLKTDLAEYQFNMRSFAAGSMAHVFEPAGMEYDCQTVACAVGYGPAAGVRPLPQDRGWMSYADRVFGTHGGDNSNDGFGFMFESKWYSTDNTPEGAAKRIRYVLEHGVPKDWRAQMNGAKPLCYWGPE